MTHPDKVAVSGDSRSRPAQALPVLFGLSGHCQNGVGIAVTNLPALDRLLDRPVAFHPVFVDLTGSVEAAVLLSQAVYWQRRCKSADGTWYTSREQWYEQTRLRRYAQEQARAALRQHTWWHEERRGIPARLHYRVDLAGLLAAIALLADVQPPGWQSDSKEPTNPMDGTSATNMRAADDPTNTEIPTDSAKTPTLRSGRSGSAAKQEPPALPWPTALTRGQVSKCVAELSACDCKHHASLVQELASRLARRDLPEVRLPHLWIRALGAAIEDGSYVPPIRKSTADPLQSRELIDARYQKLRLAVEKAMDARLARLTAARFRDGK